jgi:hypothetical protein
MFPASMERRGHMTIAATKNIKIEVGGFYVFHATITTIAEVKAISNDGVRPRVHYRVFTLDGRLINDNLIRPLYCFKSWVKGRVKPRKNPTAK